MNHLHKYFSKFSVRIHTHVQNIQRAAPKEMGWQVGKNTGIWAEKATEHATIHGIHSVSRPLTKLHK
jgi:hypothetical protein